MIAVQSDAQTHPGRKRQNNEDFVTCFEPEDQSDLNNSGRLYIVADGVGGASRGERASQYATQKVLYEYYRHPEMEVGERLARLIQQAGNEIHAFAENSPRFMRMATTMVAAVIKGNTLTVANVGDSRAYLIRDGVVQQITRDHSLVGEMVRDGVMNEQEAKRSKVRNRITRSLGGETDVRVDIFRDIPLKVGDKVLLCSDGFSKYAEKEEIAHLMAQGEPSEITSRLIDFANQRGGSDNVSTIVLDVVPESALQPTVRMPRHKVLKPVDLEEMTTQPSMRNGYDQPKSVLERWLVIVLVLCAVLIIGLGTWLVIMLLPENEDGSIAEVGVTEIATQKVIDGQEIFPTGTSTPSHPKETQPASPTQTPAPTQTPTPTLTQTARSITDTPQNPGPNEEEVGLCQYEYQNNPNVQNDAYFLVTKIFDVEMEFNRFKEYATGDPGIQCAEVSGNPCEYDPTSYHVVKSGWILDFPDIPTGKCREAGGIPSP